MGPASSERLGQGVDGTLDESLRAPKEPAKGDTLHRTDSLAASRGRILHQSGLLALQRNVGNRAVQTLLGHSGEHVGDGEQAVDEEQEAAVAERQALAGGELGGGDPRGEAEHTHVEHADGEVLSSTPAAEVPLQRAPSASTMSPQATAPEGGAAAPPAAAPPVNKEKLEQAALKLFDKQFGNPNVDTSQTEKQIEQGKKEGEFLTKAGVQSRPALAALVQQTSQPQGPGAGGGEPAGPATAPAGPATAPAGPATAPAGPATAPAGPATAPAGPATAPAGPATAPAGPATAPASGTTPAGPTATPRAGGAAGGGPAHGGSSGGGLLSRAWNSFKGFFGFGKKEGEGYENFETGHTFVESAQNVAENSGGELLSEGGKAVVELGGHVLQFINIFKIMFDARAAYKSHVSAKSLDEIAADIQANHPADQSLHEAVTAAAKAKYGEKWERIRKVAISTVALVGGLTLLFTGITLASNPVGWAVLSAMAAAGLIYLIFRFLRWLVSEDPDKAKREHLAKTVLDSAKSGDANGQKALEEILEDDAARVLAAYTAGGSKAKRAIKAVAKHLGE